MGKTSLVRQMETMAQEHNALTAYVDHSVSSGLEAMQVITSQAERGGLSFKSFSKSMTAYQQRRHEALREEQADAPPNTEPSGPSPVSLVAAQASLTGLGMVPGLGPFVGAVDATAVAHSAERLRSALSGRLRSHHDVQLLLSPLESLTPAFVQDLDDAAERRSWVVLFFDTYERAGPVLDTWLHDLLIAERYGSLPVNVLAVLAGQGRLNSACWGSDLALVQDVPLEVFTEPEARQAVAEYGVTDEPTIDVILQLSGRLPVWVTTLAATRPTDPQDVGDPSGPAVERFLKWESDPTHRTAALAGALPQHLDQDIFHAAITSATGGNDEGRSDATSLFDWLRTRPFIENHAGRCHYHEVVRDQMLRLQRTQSPQRWREQHTDIASFFAQRRQHVEDSLAEIERWHDERWLDYRSQEIYHQLCAAPQATLTFALSEAVSACQGGVGQARRWAETLVRAGKDVGSERCRQWGQRILNIVSDDPLPVLSLLLGQAELSTRKQALAHALRGRALRHSGRHHEALAAYESALSLDPENTLALGGLGETYRLMDRCDNALTYFTRAIEIDLRDDWSLAHRGITYRQMKRYDQAIADLTRAIEIAPQDDWYLNHRGLSYRLADRYEQAIADFTRAIEISPHQWAFVSRGDAYRLMERYEEALTDLTRAIEIDPRDDWAYANRGQTYQQMERYEEALTDFDRAITMAPNYCWAYANRGRTNRLMERHEEALTDLTRAIEIDPQNDWAYANRGQTYQQMERHEEALTDFDRAITMDPNYCWAIGQRGTVYQSLGRYEEALIDLTRAIEILPPSSWFLTVRAHAYRLMERYSEALSDLTRAIELTPDSAWAFASRGVTRWMLGNCEEAIDDLTHAIEIDPEDPWPLTHRASIYRAKGQQNKARSDLDRALTKSPNYLFARIEDAILQGAIEGLQHSRNRWVDLECISSIDRTASRAERMTASLIANWALRRWDRASEVADNLLSISPRLDREDIAEIRKYFEDISAMQGADRSRLREHWQRFESDYEGH
ncbi:hypothetical protein HOK021_73940 [Streptomyces hygroscopicus]|nr:hypothetical protein HOK021_73940 [Streptomyces hygroscopicus]